MQKNNDVENSIHSKNQRMTVTMNDKNYQNTAATYDTMCLMLKRTH